MGVDNGKDSVSWMQVQNKDITELNLLPKKRIVVEPWETTQKLITTLPDDPIYKTVKLHVGVDMWQVRSVKYKDGITPKTIFNAPISSFEEMNYIKYNAEAHTANIYTTYATYETSTVVEGIFVGSDIEHAIYVNGSKVIGQETSKGVTYKLRMAKGENQIQLLIINSADAVKSFKFDAYLQERATLVRAIKEAKETDEYELNYALHSDTFDKYAVRGNEIVVNYNSNDYDIRYMVDYRYNDKPQLFEDAKLRVMMVFYSKNHNLTPKVLSYQAAIL